MISLKVYSLFLFFPGFLICASNTKYIFKTPYLFKYNPNDVLNMDIRMINIPENAKYYYLNIAGNATLFYDLLSWNEWNIKIDRTAITKPQFSIKLVLQNPRSYIAYSSYCTDVDVAEGQQKYYDLRSQENKNYDCLNDSHCTIIVDLRNTCGATAFYFNCSLIDLLYVCTKQENYEVAHTWQQFYDVGSYIGTMPEIIAGISEFIFKLENFDNNTFVKVLPNHYTSNKTVVNPNVIPDDKNISHLMFTNTTCIQFDCEVYLQRTKYVYVGLINTTENKITTMNTSKITNKYSEVYNGSILCCLYYVISGDTHEKYIRRHVRNKTLLLYTQENNTDIIICLKKIDLIYAASVIGLAIFLFVVFMVIKKKYCHKTTANLVETMEFSTFATTDGVVNTAFETNRNEPTGKQEESNYAEIIGVLKPNGNANVPAQLKLN